MKIFNRVLAVALALIMSFAVLPLGIFASEPWVEVKSTTQSPNGTDTETSIVVKVDAKRLAEILKDTGLSRDLIDQIKSHISVDVGSLMQIVNMDQLLKLVPLDLFDLDAIIDELGDKVNAYFALDELIATLEDDDINALINTDNALPIILDYYEKPENGGLAGLLDSLLAGGDGTDENNDGIPDNCPVRVEELANADFWNSDCFNDGVYGVDMNTYIDFGDGNGYMTVDRFLDFWPKVPGTGAYDIGFLVLTGANPDIDADKILEDAEDKGISIIPYLAVADLLMENSSLQTLIKNNPDRYLTPTGKAKLETLVVAIVEAKTDWDPETDFNIPALKVAFGIETDLEFYNFYLANPTAVEDKLAEDVGAYLSNATYMTFFRSVVTPANLSSFGASDVLDENLREDADVDFYNYVDVDGFVNDNIDFLVKGFKTYLTDAAIDKVYDRIDMIEIAQEIGIKNLIKEEGFSTVVGWLNLDEIVDAIEADGGNVADYVYVNRAINVIGPDTAFDILTESGVAFSTIVNMDQVVPVIGATTLFGQLTVEELKELANLESVKETLPNVITTVLSKLPYIVDEITINGTPVATEDETSYSGRLSVDIKAILRELLKSIPTLDELSNIQNDKLFELAFGFTYTPEGEDEKSVTKNFKLEFVLDGAGDEISTAVTKVREAAAKLRDLLAEYIDFSMDENRAIDLDIRVPAKATSLYAKVLASEKLPDALKQKILVLTSLEGEDAIAFVKNLTFGEIVDLFESVTPTKLYDKFMQVHYVELMLNKIKEVTGKDLSGVTPDDILNKLDDAIDKAGTNSLINRVYNIIEEKTGVDVTGVLDDRTVDGIYNAAVEKADALEGKFNKVKNYFLLIADKIETYVPTIFTTAIGDLYKGNGAFNVNPEKSFHIEVKDYVERLMNKIPESIMSKIPQQAIDYIMSYIPEDLSFTVDVDVTVNFANLNRVVYHDIDGTVLLDTFLPASTNLSVYTGYTAPDGVVVDGWRLIDGTVVTHANGDIHVYPHVVEAEDYYKVTFLDEDGNVLVVFDKKLNSRLTAAEIAMIPAQTKAVEAGYEFLYKYVHFWFLRGDEDRTAINIATMVISGDLTVCSGFNKEYLFDGADNYTVDGGKYTHSNTNFAEKLEYAIPQDILKQALANPNVDLTLTGKDEKGNDVTVYIDNATLRQLAGIGTRFVVYVHDKNETFAVSYYHQNNADQYTFDFLCGDDPENLKSYKEFLVGDNKNFAGKVTLTLPFASIEQNEDQGTHVYYTNDEDNSRTLIDCTVTDTHISFDAPHFSDFVLANEYELYHEFAYAVDTDTTALDGTLGVPDNRHFFPANATVTINPVVNNGTYLVTDIYWTDAEGTHHATEIGTTGKWAFTMPAKAITLTVKATYNVYRTVTFVYYKNAETKVEESIRVLDGTSLADAINANSELVAWMNGATKDYPVATDKYLYEYSYYWYDTAKADKTEADFATYTKVTTNLTFEAAFVEEYFLAETASQFPKGATATAEIKDGIYVINIVCEGNVGSFKAVLPEAVAEYAANETGAAWAIRVTNSKTGASYNLLTVNHEMFTTELYKNGNKYVAFNYTVMESYTGLAGLYTDKNSDAYDFELLCGADAESADKPATILEQSVAVTLPFAEAKGNALETQVRVNYVDDEGDRHPITSKLDAVNKLVTITPAHFSKYVIANEYYVQYQFVCGNTAVANGSVNGLTENGIFLPAGTPITITPSVAGYYVGNVYYMNGTEQVNLDKTAGENKWSFTIDPDKVASITLVIDLRMAEYHIYYYTLQDGSYKLAETLTYTLADVAGMDAKHLAVLGCIGALDKAYAYSGWVGEYDENTLGKSDINVYQVILYKEYTVNFKKEDGTVVYQTTINYTTDKATVTLPEVPTKAGHTGTWQEWTDLNITEAIEQMIADNKTEIDIDPTYTVASYKISHDGNVEVVGNAEFGSEVEVKVIDRAFHTATATVLSETGDEIDLINGKFAMPACGVTITVTYTAYTLTYTVNGTVVDSDLFAGDTASFTVYLENGYRVASVSDFCKLAQVSANKDGSVVLTYTFVLTADDMQVAYELAKVEYDIIRILNGMLYTADGDPEIEEKKVLFAGWSDPIADAVQFATFKADPTVSYLWLWILLGAIVLILIIVLLYKLYINGKLKPNFILRFITWLANVFFAVCMFFATVGLYIMSLFGKSAEDYFLQSDEDFEATMNVINARDDEVEVTEEVIEEVAEEIAEEAVEEATEEVTEEVTEEATEEVTEEATEETVAEEVAPETAEAATEETAPETVAEEAAEDVIEDPADAVEVTVEEEAAPEAEETKTNDQNA